MSEQQPFFEDLSINQAKTTFEKTTPPEDFFTPSHQPESEHLPESVEADWAEEFEVNLAPSTKTHGLKWLIIGGVTLFILLLGFDIYQFINTLWQQSKVLGCAFAAVIATLILLILQQLWLFLKGSRRLKKINLLRDKAERMCHENSHGEAAVWLKQLENVYNDGPHQAVLTPVLQELPDYLNDAEVVGRVSEQFFSQLDRQAMQLIQRESVSSAVLIAVSQLAVMDSLLVVWKTLSMINKINQIYGIQLSRVGQLRLSLKICKAALLSYASQAGLAYMAEKTSVGLSGKIAGSIAQGVGVGIYQARLGVSAMQQIRPIAFADNALPKQQLFRTIAKLSLDKLRSRETPS